MASSYGPEEAQHLHLSGHAVWPSSDTWSPVDRWIIYGRPELRYLVALDRGARIHQGVPLKLIRSRIYKVMPAAKEKTWIKERKMTFDHVVLEDPEEDVRAYLVELRSALVRKMPPTTQLGLTCRIEWTLVNVPRKDRAPVALFSLEWR